MILRLFRVYRKNTRKSFNAGSMCSWGIFMVLQKERIPKELWKIKISKEVSDEIKIFLEPWLRVGCLIFWKIFYLGNLTDTEFKSHRENFTVMKHRDCGISIPG